MAQDDHKLPIYSLLRYHEKLVDLLAATAIGKNPENKAKVSRLTLSARSFIGCSRRGLHLQACALSPL